MTSQELYMQYLIKLLCIYLSDADLESVFARPPSYWLLVYLCKEYTINYPQCSVRCRESWVVSRESWVVSRESWVVSNHQQYWCTVKQITNTYIVLLQLYSIKYCWILNTWCRTINSAQHSCYKVCYIKYSTSTTVLLYYCTTVLLYHCTVDCS
jgi:hypothetical protein